MGSLTNLHVEHSLGSSRDQTAMDNRARPAEHVRMRAIRVPAAVTALIDRLTGGPAVLPAALRRAIFEHARASDGAAPAPDPAIPADLAPYAEKIERHAYRITDEDVAGLLAGGRSEDEVFEATLCAAAGAALLRLEAGLRALEAAGPAPAESRDAAAR